MSTLAIALMQISLVATAPTNSYATAYKATNETGRPLVVLVGADWCPGCRTMKQSVIPQLEKTGKLNQVAFATVNLDQEGKLGQSLTRGGSIPQLIMYTKKGDTWKRELMVGAHSPAEVDAFIQKGVAQSAPAKPAVATRPVSKTIQK